MKDKNEIEVKNGSVINLHQTINGENIFVVLDVKELDVRYGFDLSRKYEYDVNNLFVPDKFTGEVDYEIVGDLNGTIKSIRHE